MSTTPPEPDPSATGATATGASAGPDLTATATRGAERTGRNIWILVISLGLAVVVMIGYWLIQASHFSSINHPQVRDLNRQDVSSFNTPGGSARPAPPGEPSTTGNSQ